ncbi:MAG: InlB B-repeat-containing protein [Bacteroidales bacterium]|nr:InlB B-repeat-containing protein [Bacteroidales bacterium]
MSKINLLKVGILLILCGLLAVSCKKGSSDEPEPEPTPTPTPEPEPEPQPEPEKTEYTLTFDVNGATGSIADLKFTEGNEVKVPDASALTFDKHVFLGWSADKNATKPEYEAGGSYKGKTATLYAIWTELFKIIYHFKDSQKTSEFTAADFSKGEVTIQCEVQLDEDEILVAWKDKDGKSYENGAKLTEAADLDLTAEIKKKEPEKPKTFTLSFDANGATGTIEALTFTENAAIPDASALTFNKHKFLGWSTDPKATKPEYQSGSTYKGESATLYAVWTEVFKITYNFKGTQQATEFTAADFEQGEITIQCEVPLAENEILVWKDKDGNSYENGAKLAKAADLDLTAEISTKEPPVEPKTDGRASTEDWNYKQYEY